MACPFRIALLVTLAGAALAGCAHSAHHGYALSAGSTREAPSGADAHTGGERTLVPAVDLPRACPPVLLWETGAPNALGRRSGDQPALTAYLPGRGQRNGASVLVLPGGGYQMLADHEGKVYAEWFAAQGVAAYVLKYRLASNGYHHPAMLQDAARALRMVRAYAKRDGLDPARIAIIGSSAGGHLATTLLTHFDYGNPDSPDPIERESSRPDVGILCYAVISFGEFAHVGSRQGLLGDHPSPDLVKSLSNELQVTPHTPPCFLWHSCEDTVVPVENSLLFASALRRAGVPFSLHIYEKGEHGIGLGTPGMPALPWAGECLYWLRERNFLPMDSPK